jgi:hypothetical protein
MGKQIDEVIGTQDRKIRGIITKMVRLHLIIRNVVAVLGGEGTLYIVNSIYYLNGKTISDELYGLFVD